MALAVRLLLVCGLILLRLQILHCITFLFRLRTSVGMCFGICILHVIFSYIFQLYCTG
uniref:Uncharacterized protein n=1 Tax=Aegilops tauschii subsp. strangulata TaxID=200361 RepID=A0A452XKJ2_AEGTS